MPAESLPAPQSHTFIHHRRIVWSDTDAAAIVYTVRVPQFCMEAIEAWFLDRLGVDWYRLNVDHHIGTPFVNMSIDFRSMLTPRDALTTSVTLARLGTSSLRFALSGYADATRLAFEATFVCVFTDNRSAQTIPVPEAYRRLMANSLDSSSGQPVYSAIR